MIPLNLLVLSLAAGAVQGAPVVKRIAQVIADSTAKWEQACLSAGGGEQCNPISVTAFTTLLAAAGNCDQQNAADSMIDLAKTLNSDPTMIQLTQIFVQQPRNSPSSQAVPYCDTAPKNAELNGLFQCQFEGEDFNTFVGGLAVGTAGTIPFGLDAPVSPAGSCPANPSGPIAAGSQLVDITTNPGTPASSSSSSSSGSSADSTSVAITATEATSTAEATSSAAAAASSTSVASSTNNSGSTSTSSFALQNGQDAQKLNLQFQSLTTSSDCTDGQNACINGDFAQCVGGSYVTSSCGSGLQCLALPLVNSAGTSITCDTQADAEARIAATGATGGLTGSGSDSSSTGSSSTSSSAAASSSSVADSGSSDATTSTSSSTSSFALQNGQAAQKLNAQFQTLTASSACTDGESACINGAFAQCAGGSFVTTQCAAGLKCLALPLVNSVGTSVTCDTEADAEARIAATGATGGLTGSN